MKKRSNRIADRNEKLTFINSLAENTNITCFEIASGDKFRAQREDTTVFVFNKRSKKWGHRYSFESFVTGYDILEKSENDDAEKWHNRIARIIRCTDASGLWPEYNRQFRNLFEMDYADHKQIRELYWSETFSERMKSPKWAKWKEKYPFLFEKDNEGNDYVNTFYLYEMSDAKLKSMYFGYRNAFEKEQIAQAISTKTDYSASVCANYDVSFNYQAKDNKAWYSEEYRNCGNGHYYVALDHNTALFCEND